MTVAPLIQNQDMVAMAGDRYFNLAYRMLGTHADAEDVVQEARVRLLERSRAGNEPDDAGAYLFRMVANLAVDRLRREKVRRREYPGPWLPEPVTSEDVVATAEDLSLAMLLVLERLSPHERITFVLREAFDLTFAEIADLLGTTDAAARKRCSRARRNLADAPRPVTPASEQRQLLQSLVDAIATGNLETVMQAFSEDAVAYADGGGVVSAAIRPVTDRARIAQVLLFLVEKNGGYDPAAFRWIELAGGPAVLVDMPGESPAVVAVAGDLSDGIESLLIVRNPHKLGTLLRSLESREHGDGGSRHD